MSDGRVCACAPQRYRRRGSARGQMLASLHCAYGALGSYLFRQAPSGGAEGIGAINRGLVEPCDYTIGPRSRNGSLSGQTECTLIRSRVPQRPIEPTWTLADADGNFKGKRGEICSGPRAPIAHGPGKPSGDLWRPPRRPGRPDGGWTDPRGLHANLRW